jgi:hypothetical protein
LTIIVSWPVFVKVPVPGDTVSQVALSEASQFTGVVVELERLAVWLSVLDDP